MWGERPFYDLLEVISYVKQQTYVDSKNVFLLGESYGGYLVNWTQANRSVLEELNLQVRAMAAISGVWNIRNFACYTDEHFFTVENFGFACCNVDGNEKPCEERDVPWNPSEHYSSDLPKIPEILFHGLNDERVRFEESVRAYTNLQEGSCNSHLLLFDGVGHSFTGKKQSDLVQKIDSFFDFYLDNHAEICYPDYYFSPSS